MIIQIESSALKGKNEFLLAPGVIYGLGYLKEHGHQMAWTDSELSEHQKSLLENEGFQSTETGKDADAKITRSENLYLFQKDDEILSKSESWTELVRRILFPFRKAEINRTTKETDIHININLDGSGKSEIKTGLNFFDHMLDQIAKHGLIDLEITCKGDLEVDEHHTIEDTAIALGQAISKAVSTNKAGIQRYGFVLPMDEAQATVAIDLSDRPYLQYNVDLKREYVGDFPTEMLEHFYYTLAMNAKATLHVTANGKNDHHIIEATFKGFARALRFAITRSERTRGILPSTKGTI
ncbi:imidazoleglycerol-phosphate dehydratase HisB [Rhodohalobacter barkolensis]|uniref:Imidazoleglycerol-phosphate dehydratase n=1 Tax=Rhodohalobacter barkolensis TaxID=2053187 RepID=A0A2N0VHC8_9BACT|nr:imidazoleglycerol-phosphate dehydratase HisB [Rhodohalobacter barkolensis]PKD43595.1 imidazoleglycerol-phosphate dehydratase HisB [Rhodohalobacter barkolensis]